MAMLAEPRQRKRYNLVPRGKALYEDDSRYGTKMLEKMGWEKGKGLGANEDGTKDFVRIRYKNDALGLGFEHRDDQWTQHEESFNGLLKTLNNEEDDANTNVQDENGNGSEDDMPRIGFGFQDPSAKQEKKPKVEKLKEKISGISLEERSKQSRARVHYKKFTKGKDLAQYSEKDLANIFGKKVADEQQAANDFYQQLNNTFVKKEETKDEQEEPNKGVQIINTGVSVSDYFKTKMEALKNRNNGFDGADKKVTSNDEQIEEEVSKKKKKKKKDKDQDMEEEISNETKKEEPNGLIINHDVSVADYFKMKMDAIKNRKNELNNSENNVDKTCTNDEVQEVEVTKKKKKNKKVVNDEENDTVNKDNGQENCINDEIKKEAEISIKKEKKSKKSNAVDTVELSPEEETNSKKKDKTKKRTQKIGDQNEEIELPLIKKTKYDNSPAENTIAPKPTEAKIEIDLTQEPSKKKLKKSKTKESNEVIEIDDSDKETNPVSLNEVNLMEKKKKKKSKKTKEHTESSEKGENSTSSHQTENATGHPSEKTSKAKRKDKNSAI